MRCCLPLALMFTVLPAMVTAGVRTASASFDDAFWVSYWGQPKIILNGPEEEAFYRGLKEVVFARNVYDQCENPRVLDDDARWLKEHSGVRFYIDGYASKRGNLEYNLIISQRRADWVKQSLISRGVAEDRIKLAVGWGVLPTFRVRRILAWIGGLKAASGAQALLPKQQAQCQAGGAAVTLYCRVLTYQDGESGLMRWEWVLRSVYAVESAGLVR